MRQALTDAEIDVEIEKAKTGPQLYAVVSAQDAQNPGAATKGSVWQVALCTQLGNKRRAIAERTAHSGNGKHLRSG